MTTKAQRDELRAKLEYGSYARLCLTNAQLMTNLPAGPELDRLVGEAIGRKPSRHAWESQGCNHYGDAWFCKQCGAIELSDCVPDGECLPPYSTDWSGAMEAAEEFGLFDHNAAALGKLEGQWVIEPPSVYGIQASTGPLAICRAILMLTGEKK